jgi:hypothetical protein
MPPIPREQVSPYPHIDERYLSTRQVRQRYGDASEMWVWRRLNDGSRFPQPTLIAGRRFWRLSDLVQWEREQRSCGHDIAEAGSTNET